MGDSFALGMEPNAGNVLALGATASGVFKAC